jgi:hypothetical protein
MKDRIAKKRKGPCHSIMPHAYSIMPHAYSIMPHAYSIMPRTVVVFWLLLCILDSSRSVNSQERQTERSKSTPSEVEKLATAEIPVLEFGDVSLSKYSSNSLQLNLGDIEPKRSYLIQIRIKNDGKQEATIDNVSTSCGCAQGRISTNKLLPEEIAVLVLEMKRVDREGSFGIELRADIDGKNSIATIKGNCVHPYSPSPERPVFVQVDGELQTTFILGPRTMTDGRFSLSRSSLALPGFEITSLKEIDNGELEICAKRISKNDSNPDIHFEISGEYTRNDGTQGTLALPCIGIIIGKVVSNPSKIALDRIGNQFLGKALLRSGGGKPITIQAIRVGGKSLPLSSEEVAVRKLGSSWLINLSIDRDLLLESESLYIEVLCEAKLNLIPVTLRSK